MIDSRQKNIIFSLHYMFMLELKLHRSLEVEQSVRSVIEQRDSIGT